jgi:hypothetical protein
MSRALVAVSLQGAFSSSSTCKMSVLFFLKMRNFHVILFVNENRNLSDSFKIRREEGEESRTAANTQWVA